MRINQGSGGGKLAGMADPGDGEPLPQHGQIYENTRYIGPKCLNSNESEVSGHFGTGTEVSGHFIPNSVRVRHPQLKISLHPNHTGIEMFWGRSVR